MKGPKIIYEIGTKFGEWTVINDKPIPKGNGYYHFECQCSCGVIRTVSNSNLKRGISTNCGCIRYKNPAHNYQGLGNLSQKYFTRLRKGAEQRHYEFDLTKEYLLKIFNGKCNLSGVDIELNRNTEKQTASVDRIDSSKGYVEGNVQWIHKKLNWLKRSMSDKDFIDWCKLIAKNNE